MWEHAGFYGRVLMMIEGVGDFGIEFWVIDFWTAGLLRREKLPCDHDNFSTV